MDFEGRLILAESTTGKILRISKDARKLENLADSYDGYRMAKIDGLMGNQNGDIYVGSPHTATLYKINSLQGRLSILNDDLVRSNDIVIDDQGTRLVVAESDPNRLAVYDLNSSNETIIGWNLVTFPDNSPPPTSLDFIDQSADTLRSYLVTAKPFKFLISSEENKKQVTNRRVYAFDVMMIGFIYNLSTVLSGRKSPDTFNKLVVY